jgi:uncharacterized protein (TIGR02611 family)
VAPSGYAERAVATEDPPKPRIVQRLEAQRERHRRRPLVVRVLYIVVGFTLLLGGVAMLVLPGPAFLVIPIGLALLSLEFAWAENLLERALEQGESAKRKAAETTTTQRTFTAIAFVLGGGALVAWAVLGDIPLVPV